MLIPGNLAEEAGRLAAGSAGVGDLLGLEDGDMKRAMEQDLRHRRSGRRAEDRLRSRKQIGASDLADGFKERTGSRPCPCRHAAMRGRRSGIVNRGSEQRKPSDRTSLHVVRRAMLQTCDMSPHHTPPCENDQLELEYKPMVASSCLVLYTILYTVYPVFCFFVF